MSLAKLKVKALILDFKVAFLLVQKFIKKNEVKPINSHPKNKVKKLFPNTNIIILKIKLFNQNKNLPSSLSPLK
jgi:ribosomal protein S3AE